MNMMEEEIIAEIRVSKKNILDDQKEVYRMSKRKDAESAWQNRMSKRKDTESAWQIILNLLLLLDK
jgi:hypothetical protein